MLWCDVMTLGWMEGFSCQAITENRAPQYLWSYIYGSAVKTWWRGSLLVASGSVFIIWRLGKSISGLTRKPVCGFIIAPPLPSNISVSHFQDLTATWHLRNFPGVTGKRIKNSSFSQFCHGTLFSQFLYLSYFCSFVKDQGDTSTESISSFHFTFI